MTRVMPLLLALLAAETMADPAGVRVDRSWVFERAEHHWRRIPPETGASYDGEGVFTIFYPSGDLVQVTGWELRTRSGQISLCMGCGFIVWTGSWTRTGSKVSARLSLRSSALQELDPATNEPIPKEKVPVREETWTVEDRGARGLGRRLLMPDGRHVPLSPRFEDLQRLQALAQP